MPGGGSAGGGSSGGGSAGGGASGGGAGGGGGSSADGGGGQRSDFPTDDSAGGGGDGDGSGGGGDGDPFGDADGAAGGGGAAGGNGAAGGGAAGGNSAAGGGSASGGGSAGNGVAGGDGAGSGGQGGDEEFDRSLGDFDRDMEQERERVAREGGGPAADSAVGRPADAGSGIGQAEVGGDGNSDGGPAGAQVRELGPDDAAAVATVQGCNDADRVARQLCEAATKEEDPFLRAALWDEYNEYKKLLAR
jgi:hypothetical protein